MGGHGSYIRSTIISMCDLSGRCDKSLMKGIDIPLSMAGYGRCDDLTSLVVNPTSILPEIPLDKVRYLLLESQSMRDDYQRDIVINYIAGNYSSNKHLCSTILNGKEDKEILELLDEIEAMILEELDARKRNGTPSF